MRDVYRQATEEHAAAFALLRPKQRGELAPNEQRRCADLDGNRAMALPNSSLPANPVMAALFDACVALISAEVAVQLHVVRLIWLDWESCQLLMKLLKVSKVRDKLWLTIDDPERIYADYQRCLTLKNRPGLDAESLRRELLCGAVDELSQRMHGDLFTPSSGGPFAEQRRRLSSNSRLKAESHIASNVLVAHAAMRHAAACHSLSTALIFAERVSRMAGTQEQLSQDAALVGGVAAYNLGTRQPRQADIAVEYFAQVASRNDDMALRSHGLYRLSLHEAQVRQRLPQALKLADEAIRHAQSKSVDVGRSGIYVAWAYRAKVVVLQQQQRPKEAAEVCRKALRAVSPEQPAHETIPEQALIETRAFMAHLLQQLAHA